MTAYQHEGAFYALLAPTTSELNKTFLTVTVSDGTTSQDLTVKGIPATTAGKSYSLSLTVGKDVASIGSVSVADWTGGTVIADTEAKELFESSINGTTLTMTVYNATPEETKAVIADALVAGCRTLDITLGSTVFNPTSTSFSGNIDLVLHANKQSAVSGTTWNGYTFKSITYVGEEATE